MCVRERGYRHHHIGCHIGCKTLSSAEEIPRIDHTTQREKEKERERERERGVKMLEGET